MSFKDIRKKRAKKANSCKLLKEGQRNVYDIIIKYLFTEKNHNQRNDLNKYVFQVDPKANKNDIKAAIEAMYGVSPKKVNTVNCKDKYRARRWKVRKKYKKAYVTLKEWDKIEIVNK